VKAGQSKITNYAKRTQFFKKSSVYNLNNNNQLQQKMANGHLVKTNPNEPNLWGTRPARLSSATGQSLLPRRPNTGYHLSLSKAVSFRML
jgi:hypothetical protein